MAKFKCWGAKWEIANATGTTFAEVPQVMNLDVPQATTDEIEVTTLDNTTGYREFLPSFKDGGEMGFTVVYDNVEHSDGADTIWQLFQDGTIRNMRIFLPTTTPGVDYTFPGYIKAL